MKMLNIHDDSNISCKPKLLASTADPASWKLLPLVWPDPWGLQDLLGLCSGHLLWGACPWLVTSGGRHFAFPVPHPEGVVPWNSSVYGCLYLGA